MLCHSRIGRHSSFVSIPTVETPSQTATARHQLHLHFNAQHRHCFPPDTRTQLHLQLKPCRGLWTWCLKPLKWSNCVFEIILFDYLLLPVSAPDQQHGQDGQVIKQATPRRGSAGRRGGRRRRSSSKEASFRWVSLAEATNECDARSTGGDKNGPGPITISSYRA